jgi:PAS domain S-box-containing protein
MGWAALAWGGAEISAPVPYRDTSPYGLALTQELVASLPAAVAYLSGPDLVVDFANDACVQLVGHRELLGRPLSEVLPELAEQGAADIPARIMETGEPFRGSQAEVLIHRRGQAEQRFVDYVYQPVRDAGGGVAGILLYAADVTAHVRDRRELEEVAARLAAADERHRTLFETMPPGVIHYAADGSVLGANPAARQILGLADSEMTSWPLATVLRSVHEDGTQFRPEELPVHRALSTGAVVSDVLMGVPHGQTGERRWVLATAIPDARDDRGRPQRVYAMFTDVTEQRQVEAALRESTSLLGRLREANVLGVVSSTEQGTYEANEAFLDIIGYSRDDLAAGRISYQSITAPEWAARDRRALEQLRRSGACQPYDKEYVHRDGYRVPVLVGAAVIDWDPLRWVTFVVDLTVRQHAERQRAELLARERAARAEARSAGDRLAFLMQAGALVAATRDPDELLDQVTQLVVPSLADCCMVFLPTPDGTLRVSALTHADPARTRKLAALREHPVPTAGPLMSQRAYTTGITQLVRDVAAELPSWATVDPDATEIVASVHPRSALATPLLVGQRTLGVMVMYRGRGRPRFASTDTEMVEEIARRLAVGLANADTFAREHDIAETLQRSILPDTLPRIPGLDLAVRYLPATQGANVGGDWYDAFPLDGGRIALVTGDVSGHSIGSASDMGQVRSMLRAYAIDNPDPGHVLRRTNAAVARLLPETLASVVYAVLDLGTGDLAYANAGHPPPILVRAAGQAEYLDDTAGIMLGACADALFTTGLRRLCPGTGLLCYTDGLIEDRHRDLTKGLQLLAGTLRLSAPFSAEQMCAIVEASLLGAAHRADDVCLLAAQLTG